MVSIEELARLQGITVAEVAEHIEELVRTGWVTPVDSDDKTTTYAFTIPEGVG